MGQEFSTDGQHVPGGHATGFHTQGTTRNGVPDKVQAAGDEIGGLPSLDEDELKRRVRNSSDNVDIYDTGVSADLKKLLATLDDSETTADSGAENVRKVGLSAAAQEFVPGRGFATDSNERDRSGSSDATVAASRAKVLGGAAAAGAFNAEAPEFIPSWGASTVADASGAGATALGDMSAMTAEPKSMFTAGGMGMGAAAAVAGLGRNVRVIDKKCWWYRDPSAVVRGPFSTTEMRAWADKGYFQPALEIALSDRGPFLPLSAVYPPPERAFWKSVEPREFAMRMKQHMNSVRSMAMGGNAIASVPPGF